MKPPTAYTCKVCGAPVKVTGGTVDRSCEHKDSTVVASIAATAYGLGRTGNKQASA